MRSLFHTRTHGIPRRRARLNLGAAMAEVELGAALARLHECAHLADSADMLERAVLDVQSAFKDTSDEELPAALACVFDEARVVACVAHAGGR